MLDFMKKLATKRQKQQETAYDTYRRLIQKAAEDKATEADVDQLEALGKQLGFSDQDMERDAAAVREYNQLMSEGADHAKLADQLERDQDALRRWDAETRKWVEERNPKLNALIAKVETTTKAHRIAAEAFSRATEVKREHFKILGAEDPAIANSRVHVVQAYNAAPVASPLHAITFEAVVRQPSAFLSVFDPFGLESVKFIAAPGQSEAERDELVKLLRDWCAGKIPRPAYFIQNARAMVEQPINREMIVLFEETLKELEGGAWVEEWGSTGAPVPTYCPQKHTPVPFPGQSRRELAAMTAKLEKAYNGHPLIRQAREREREAGRPDEPKPHWSEPGPQTGLSVSPQATQAATLKP